MKWFQCFYLDKEKDIIVDLYMQNAAQKGAAMQSAAQKGATMQGAAPQLAAHKSPPRTMTFILSTPNHGTGNLIRNLAALCGLPLSEGEDGLLVIRGTVPSYIDGYNRLLYIFRLGDTKVANIYPDGRVEIKYVEPPVYPLPEDEIGAYAIRKDGTKEYLIFQTYDICMTYLGRDELCAGPERCYHK